MRDRGDHYEYLSIWVDDVLCVSKDPAKVMDVLRGCGYNLKGVPPEYYLGGDFGRMKSSLLERGSTTYLSARTYISNICEKIEEMLDVKLKSYHMPMEPDYRPETDDTDLLSAEMGSKYRM